MLRLSFFTLCLPGGEETLIAGPRCHQTDPAFAVGRDGAGTAELGLAGSNRLLVAAGPRGTGSVVGRALHRPQLSPCCSLADLG